MASAADELWAIAHMDSLAAEEGGEDAWRPTRGAFLKKKWFSNIYFDNKMFFLLKILL